MQPNLPSMFCQPIIQSHSLVNQSLGLKRLLCFVFRTLFCFGLFFVLVVFCFVLFFICFSWFCAFLFLFVLFGFGLFFVLFVLIVLVLV